MPISRSDIPKEISMKKGGWIKKATKNKGALRKATDTPKGKKIPKSTLNKLAKGKGKNAKRARLALTLEKMRGKKKKKA
jgi:hypothetical protein